MLYITRIEWFYNVVHKLYEVLYEVLQYCTLGCTKSYTRMYKVGHKMQIHILKLVTLYNIFTTWYLIDLQYHSNDNLEYNLVIIGHVQGCDKFVIVMWNMDKLGHR